MRRRLGLSHDENGALAAKGRVDRGLLARWMQDPYFRRPAPKSLDRNHFHALAADAEALSDADGAATLAAFCIEATAAALAQVPEAPRLWLVCGGGRKNRTLMAGLAARLQSSVEPIEAISQDGDFVEAACFAHLALRARRGLPISLPTTTGAPVAMTGGAFFPAIKKGPAEAGPSRT